MLENNVSSLFQRLRGSICFLFLYKHNFFFFFEAKYVFGAKIIKKKIKYAKLLSKIISDAKYILLFHISS